MEIYCIVTYLIGICVFIAVLVYAIRNPYESPENTIPFFILAIVAPVSLPLGLFGGVIYSIAFTIAKHIPSVKDE